MSKTLRVRLPSGRTHRVQVDRNEDFSTFLAKVYSLGEKLMDASLFCDPSFQQPFSMSSATHGMMIFVKAQKESPNTNEASSSAAAAPASSPSGSISNPKPSTPDSKRSDPTPGRLRCRHGPRGMCEQCMPKEDKRERYESEIRKWKGKGMSVAVMEAREALKHKIVSQDEPHLSAAVVSDSAGHAFQAYLAQIGFSQQRLGYCYGRVNDENESEIHAIFEPMQNGDDKCYNVIEGEAADEGATRASAIAEQLGLSPVGIVFSACPRKSILSGADLVFAAKFASKLTEEQRKGFVVLVVFVTENGETVFEAYQISDLAIELSKNNVFEGFDKQKKNGGRVLCTEEVLVEGKDTKKVHTEFFLLNIPIKKLTSWLATDFPVENRELQPQRPQHLSEALSKTSEPYYRRISDFHLLLFLSDTFQVDTDMPGLTTCVREQEGEVEEGYQLMIQSLANAS